MSDCWRGSVNQRRTSDFTNDFSQCRIKIFRNRCTGMTKTIPISLLLLLHFRCWQYTTILRIFFFFSTLSGSKIFVPQLSITLPNSSSPIEPSHVLFIKTHTRIFLPIPRTARKITQRIYYKYSKIAIAISKGCAPAIHPIRPRIVLAGATCGGGRARAFNEAVRLATTRRAEQPTRYSD